MPKGDDVTKGFGGITVLSSLDFHVEEGKIVGVIGPNGSRKTTLFDIISGFCHPKSDLVPWILKASGSLATLA